MCDNDFLTKNARDLEPQHMNVKDIIKEFNRTKDFTSKFSRKKMKSCIYVFQTLKVWSCLFLHQKCVTQIENFFCNVIGIIWYDFFFTCFSCDWKCNSCSKLHLHRAGASFTSPKLYRHFFVKNGHFMTFQI